MNRFERGRFLTAKYQDELTPCKYCGEKPWIQIELDIFKTPDNPKGYRYSVTCPTRACDCHLGKTLPEAIVKWEAEQAKPVFDEEENENV